MTDSRTDGPDQTRAWRVTTGAVIVGGYLSLYWVSQHAAGPADVHGVVWLPAGLVTALLLSSTRRAWPAVLALSGLAHLVGALTFGVDSPRIVLASLCATSLAAVGCGLSLHRWHGRDVSLQQPRDALMLLFPSALAGCAAGAIGFALLGHLGGDVRSLVAAFSGWFAAAFLGLAIVVPVQLLALEAMVVRRFSVQREAPGMLLLVAFAWLVSRAFMHDPSEQVSAFDLPLASLPLLLWIFLEFDLLLVALCGAILGLFSAAGTAAGLGPFATATAATVLPSVQWTVAFFGSGVLVLAAALRSSGNAPEPRSATCNSRQEFVEDSVQGYWYAHVDPPVPLSLTPGEQVERLLDCARFAAADPNATTLQRLLGTTHEALVGLTLRECGEYLHVDLGAGLRRFVADHYRLHQYQWRVGSGPREGQAIRSTGRGEIRNGMLHALWGADLDVSEQRDAETALRYSEERFYRTFKNTSDAVVIVSMADARVINVNDAFESLSGFARADVMGRDPRTFLRIESPRSRRRLLRDLGRRGIARDHEIRFMDNSDRPLTCLVSAELVDLGGQACLVAIGHDITQQRAAEAALRQSEQRFAMAFRNSPDAIVLTEFASGNIVELNEGFERMTGLKRDAALGRSMVELGGWSDPREREKMMAILRREGRVEQFEIESPRSDSHILTLSLSAELIELEDRELLIVTARDITESRRVARTLELYQQRLKSLVSQLTLTEERVRRRIAIEVHDGLSQELAATIMQLTALRGTLDEAAQQSLSESIDILSQSMTSARNMVNRLSRRQLYESGVADALAALARDTATEEEFDCVFEDRRAEQGTDGAENVRIVLYRSVDELLQNVARYAQARCVELTLDHERDNLVVTVADDGDGFDTEALDTSGWTQKGFGLFSIRQQIESLGGEFTLASVLGEGTTVILSVPCRDDDEQQPTLSA